MISRIVPFGEAALLVELEGGIDPVVAARAAAIADRWDALGHGPATPTYASVLLRWDPLALDASDADRSAREIVGSVRDVAPLGTDRVVEVPTRYDGPDLEDVARASGMSVPELVSAHTSRDHLAYFLGFMPGFAYCGGLDPRIVAPRLASPRPRVPAGAVAVADGQTAVYPADSPGGWRILGRTELVVFDAAREEPSLIRAGDRVRFVAL